jgi:hypothetical protein
MRNVLAVCLLFLSGSLAVAAEPPTALIHIGPNDFTTETLGQEIVEGHNYLIVQAEARNGRVADTLGYCRIRAWYDMQERVTRKVLLLDHNDVIFTTIRFTAFTLDTGTSRASRMEVTNHATGQTTVFDLDGLTQPINPLTLI